MAQNALPAWMTPGPGSGNFIVLVTTHEHRLLADPLSLTPAERHLLPGFVDIFAKASFRLINGYAQRTVRADLFLASRRLTRDALDKRTMRHGSSFSAHNPWRFVELSYSKSSREAAKYLLKLKTCRSYSLDSHNNDDGLTRTISTASHNRATVCYYSARASLETSSSTSSEY